MAAKNVRCTLITGQEMEKTGEDTHVSCTVEMANISKQYEVRSHKDVRCEIVGRSLWWMSIS